MGITTEAGLDPGTGKAAKILALARRLHEQARMTGNPALERAYRRAMLRYMGEISKLRGTGLEWIRQQYNACIDEQRFLARKMDLMQKTWQDRFYEQFVEVLSSYELVYDQVQALEVGVETGAEELAASGRADGAGGDGSPAPVSIPTARVKPGLAGTG